MEIRFGMIKAYEVRVTFIVDAVSGDKARQIVAAEIGDTCAMPLPITDILYGIPVEAGQCAGCGTGILEGDFFCTSCDLRNMKHIDANQGNPDFTGA